VPIGGTILGATKRRMRRQGGCGPKGKCGAERGCGAKAAGARRGRPRGGGAKQEPEGIGAEGCEPQPAAAAKEGPRLELTEVHCSTRAQGRVAVSGVDRGRDAARLLLTMIQVICRMVERARRAQESRSEAARRVTRHVDGATTMG
jgi:hypothetical protein